MSIRYLVRLFPEHGGAFPVWGLRGDPRRRLSRELIARLREWATRWEAEVAYPIEPGTNPRTERWVAEQSRPLRLDVQRELGRAFRVVSLPPERMEFPTEIDGPVAFPPPPGRFWWEESPVPAGNRIYSTPPHSATVDDLLGFWRHVDIPGDVVTQIERQIARRLPEDGRDVPSNRAAAWIEAWDGEHPEPDDPADRGIWLSDRDQIVFEAQFARTPGALPPRCQDPRSIARAVHIHRALTRRVMDGQDPEDAELLAALASPLPWGQEAVTVEQLVALFPGSLHWVPLLDQERYRLSTTF